MDMPGNPFDIPARVMLEGASGTGKTALCSFIVLQWARQTGSLLERYKMVLFIELKRVQPTGNLNAVFLRYHLCKTKRCVQHVEVQTRSCNSSHIHTYIENASIFLISPYSRNLVSSFSDERITLRCRLIPHSRSGFRVSCWDLLSTCSLDNNQPHSVFTSSHMLESSVLFLPILLALCILIIQIYVTKLRVLCCSFVETLHHELHIVL